MTFTEEVIQLIQNIPKGKVATYGQIAALGGKPQGARGVSWILHSSTKKHNLPWYRVIGAKGKISIPPTSKYFKLQKKLLEAEGVEFIDKSHVDLPQFQWKKQRKVKKVSSKQPKMFSGDK